MRNMIIEEIRNRIRASGKSLNQIGRSAGVDVASLSRVMHGGDCKTLTADRLLRYFGLAIVRKKRKKGADES